MFLLFRAGDADIMVLQNVVIYLELHMALGPERPMSPSSPVSEPQVLQFFY